MKRTFILLFVIIILSFTFVSCISEVVTYCPFCGSAGIKEVSVYNKETGLTTVYYQCTNSKCGKVFGAGQIEQP
jgi:hypothetical protein